MLESELDLAPGTQGYPFPGTSTLILSYIRSGHEVTLVTTAQDISQPLKVDGTSLTLIVLPARRRARSKALDFFAKERRQIERVLREISPDVIHAHWTYEFGLAARAVPFPSLITVHDWAPAVARRNRHVYWYFRAVMQLRCLSKKGAVSAPTRYIADKVSRWYGSRCEVIPNGIDLRAYADAEPSVDSAAVGMLNVGFSSLKNVHGALMSWPAVRQLMPTATLHLAGPDYERGGPAWKWAQERGLSEGVFFDGALKPQEVPLWLAAKTVFLHTSYEESFGNVLVEAMAAGTPVVAGRESGAVPEVTKGAALLVDVSDPSAISDGVIAVLADEDLQRRMQLRGREAAGSYDMNEVAESYLRVLTTLVGK